MEPSKLFAENATSAKCCNIPTNDHRNRWPGFIPSDAVDGVAEDQGPTRMLLQEVVEVQILLGDGAVDAGLRQGLGSPDFPGDVDNLRFRFDADH